MHLRKRNPAKGPEGNSKSDDMAVDEGKKQKIDVISQDGETAGLQGKSQMPPQIYAVSITICIVLGFMVIALIWKFDFSPFMVLIIAFLNDGTIMTILKDRVNPSPTPDS